MGGDWESGPRPVAHPSSPDQRCSMFRNAASGYAWARFKSDGWAWVDSLPLRDWAAADAARLLACLSFSSEAWQRLEALGPSVGELYWPAVNANISIEPDQLLPGIEMLLANGRPYVAMRLLHRGPHQAGSINRDSDRGPAGCHFRSARLCRGQRARNRVTH